MDRLRIRSRRLLVVAGIVLLSLLLAVPVAQAFEGRGGDVVTIAADEVVDDDLYVAAGEFVLDGVVTGDLFVVGGTIEINGTVEGDLVAAGQNVVVNGAVEDDARIAGYALLVGGEVADDLIAVGFGLELEPEAEAGGDLLFGGYQAALGGDVAGDVDLGGGALEIAGAIGGDVRVDLGETAPDQQMPPGFPFFTPPDALPLPSVPLGLTVSESASIGGDLTYTAVARADIPSGAVAGDVEFTEYVPDVEEGSRAKAPSPAVLVGRWFLRQVRRLVTLLLVGAVMMWLAPGWTRKLADIVRTKPLPSLGWGVVAIAAFALAMLVLFIATVLLAIVFGIVTLGGLSGRLAVLGGLVTGAVGLGFNVTWAYVTRVVIGVLLGQLIFRLFKSTAAEHRWWPMLLGVFVFAVVAAVPVLGWLARLAAVLLGLGAIWLWASDWVKSRRPAPVAAEVSGVSPEATGYDASSMSPADSYEGEARGATPPAAGPDVSEVPPSDPHERV